MKEIRAYRTLQSFTNIEINRFKKFIHSPYFNNDKRAITLFNFYIHAIEDSHKNEILSESEIWKRIYPDEKEDLALLRRINNSLVNLLVEFLAQEEIKGDQLLYNNLKLKGSASKKLPFLHNAIRRKNEKRLQYVGIDSSNYYYNQYIHQQVILDITTDLNILKSKSKIEKEINLDKVSHNLDQFYIIEKLKLYINLLSWNISYRIVKQIDHIDKIKAILRESKDQNIIVSAYLLMAHMLENTDDDRYFSKLNKILQVYKTSFSQSDYRYIYESLIKFCMIRINRGNNEYNSILLQVYKDALTNPVFNLEDFITEISFNNIVGLACRSNEFIWAENFIVEYGKYLNPKIQLSIKSFSSARISFYRKEYEEVIEKLQRVEYEKIMDIFNSKIMLLSAYYELKEKDALESLLNSLKVFVKREKSVTIERKKRYNNYINFLKRISNVNPRDKKKIMRIKDKLVETNGVLSKSWLIEKIDELLT